MNLARFKEVAISQCRLDLNLPVLVGVSGGPDSLCLLDSLSQAGFRVVAAHFNHQLRLESGQDADRVRQAAEALNVPFNLGSLDVAAYAAETHRSIEEAARQARYRFLFDQARRFGAQAVAVGHTADDQVETVLMHLLRGAGWNGLTGMDYRTVLPIWDAKIPLVRPLLTAWRAETLTYCRERGLEPVFDASNQDTVFTRNRIRLELLPLLESFNAQAKQAIWRSAWLLAEDNAILQEAVQAAWTVCHAEVGEGVVSLERAALRDLAPALQRRVLRQAALLLEPGLADLDFAATERAVQFAQSTSNGQIDLVNGLRLVAEGARVWVSGPRALPASADWPQMLPAELAIDVPGRLDLAPGWQLVSEWVEAADLATFRASHGFSTADRWEAWLDADSLPGPLHLRCPQPGDRFQPLGMQGRSTLLSDFWINQKLPQRARAGWPLVMSVDQIAWVPGFRLSHLFRIQSVTQRALHLRLQRK